MRFSKRAKVVAFVASVTMGFASILGTGTTPNTDPTACPSIQIEYLKVPTAAMAWKWAHHGTKHGFNWGAVRRPGTEAFFNVSYVPQGGWTVPDDTVGLAFTMFTRVDDQLGFDYSETVAVAYVMEYTFPIAKCNMAASWDTRLSITLPRGICVTDAGNPSNCTSDDTVYADFQMFTVQDPSGTMSVTGAGRSALEDAIMAAMEEQDSMAHRLFLNQDTQSSHSQTTTVQGNFNVSQDIRAKVFVGVSAMLTKDPHGYLCTNKCTTAPGDKLMDDAIFRLEGADGSIGVGLSKLN